MLEADEMSTLKSMIFHYESMFENQTSLTGD